ncbi:MULTISPECIES: response regulator [Sphingobacterium]|uniref:Response regulator n=1 Tax=Sphingobacterium athyrii TaxID=2152717 RepID=A0A363P097_9SPHI|nr:MULTISPECIES: response regulator transcription factor [Sphingobacterium]PUV26420.1 response regulator [Sphingobacterium athyrii]QIH32706.1 response regulator [Sphingobacterium sp. DR205]
MWDKKKRILVVEDNEILLGTMQFVLLREGYDLLLAKSGKEALTLVSDESIDLVITDLALPFANGFEIIDRIRKSNTNNQVPVIIISGYHDDNSIVEGFEVGANDYMKKPISPTELISRVRLRIGHA